MKYSQRLGELTEVQFQKALDTFNLGKFISAEPILQGLFGQNLYLTSDLGHFVLRGKPHYDWQFPNEKLMVDLLKSQTSTPVPFPYLFSQDKSVFGWDFIIMPRMEGINLSDDLKEDFLTEVDRLEIACAQGLALAEAQKLTYTYCGKFDITTNSIKKYNPDWITQFSQSIILNLEKAIYYNEKTPSSDIQWSKELILKSQEFLTDFTPCFFMQDYKPGNMVVSKIHNTWKVTGIFDLMEASFGHPEADLSRMFAVYIDNNRADLALAFINSYLNKVGRKNGFKERFPLFMLHDRAIIWEWAQRTNRCWWDKNWTFKEWVLKFIESIDNY